MPRDERRLGKGLAALLGEHIGTDHRTEDREIPIESLRANPFQPRGEFEPQRLAELADSIRENGLLQPIVVRAVGERFEIVVGERRFRAIQSLGWPSVPAVVRGLSDEQMLVVALVENLQRHDLSALEEARGYRRLRDEFGLTQEQVGRHVGRDRSTVANALRLLSLPEAVLRLLAQGDLSAGHGRALLMLNEPEDQVRLAMTAVEEGWSVRETERQVRRSRSPRRRGGTKGSKTQRADDPVLQRAERGLERGFGTRVRIRARADGAGEVVVRFHDGDDFLRLMALLGGDALAAELRG